LRCSRISRSSLRRPSGRRQPSGNNFGAGSGDIFDDFSADSLVGTPDNPFGVVDTTFAGDVSPAQHITGRNSESRRAGMTADFVGTPPTVVAGSLLVAHLLNNTGRTLFEILVSYDLGIQNGNVTTAEEAFAGHRVYWSLTGELGSWNPIGDFGYRGDPQCRQLRRWWRVSLCRSGHCQPEVRPTFSGSTTTRQPIRTLCTLSIM
jgi:hypothetical protein